MEKRSYGAVLADARELMAAAEQLRAALRLAPSDPDTLCDYAVLLAEGAVDGQTWAAGGSDSELGQGHEGAELTKEQMLGAAESCYARCLRVDGRHVRALFNYACLLFNTGRLSSAEECFKKALRIEPDNALINAEYGSLLVRVDPGRARLYFEKVLQADPSNRRALVGLASILSSDCRQGAATSHAGKDKHKGQDGRAEAGSAGWGPAAALALLQRSVKLYPADVDSMCHLAAHLSLLHEQHHDAAILYDRALALSPDNTAALCDKATLLRVNLNDAPQARLLYLKALDADPTHLPSLCGLAQLLVDLASGHADGEDAAAAHAEAERLMRRAVRQVDTLQSVMPPTDKAVCGVWSTCLASWRLESCFTRLLTLAV